MHKSLIWLTMIASSGAALCSSPDGGQIARAGSRDVRVLIAARNHLPPEAPSFEQLADQFVVLVNAGDESRYRRGDRDLKPHLVRLVRVLRVRGSGRSNGDTVWLLATANSLFDRAMIDAATSSRKLSLVGWAMGIPPGIRLFRQK